MSKWEICLGVIMLIVLAVLGLSVAIYVGFMI